MAVASPSSTETLEPRPDKSDPDKPPTSSLPSASAPESSSSDPPSTDPPNPNPNPNPNPTPQALVTPLPPSLPSFRPLGIPPAPQYSTFPNPNVQNPGIQPPGVSAPFQVMPPGAQMRHMYQYAPGQPLPGAPMPYGHVQVPNGYMPMPSSQAPVMIPPPGIPRYPGPYPSMVRPGFPPRPMPPMGVIPQLTRPPIPGVRGVTPGVTPVRPIVPIVAPTEKPQTTVYVGKIAPTVDNDFLLSILRLCGPVKSWKRAQDPSDGTPKGFGFCEFESAEGILRALRLLSKLNIDGQELVLNINQATREYLERYVEKKTEREKLKETESQAVEKENESEPAGEKQEPPKPVVDEAKKQEEDSGDKENQENQKFGIVTDEDRDADRDAMEKITSMIEERLKTKPLPPPPPPQIPADSSAKLNSEVPSKSRDGDSDVDIMKTDAAEEKNGDETTSETKPASEHDKPETSSPDRGKKHDRRSRERDKERDLKREKERELERYERERERERVRRERERDLKMREAERQYRDRVKELEAREREKEYQRQYEKEREKERQRERQNRILKEEDGSDEDDDDTRKRRRRSSMVEERRRKRQREKEEDLTDRIREEEEIAEAKKRAIEEQLRREESKPLSVEDNMEIEMNVKQDESIVEGMKTAVGQSYESVSDSGNDNGDAVYRESSVELPTASDALADVKPNTDVPTRKLGFGLIASGKRTTVPSVFHQEDDEDVDEKKMRPLVPIDYSTEELQAVQTTVSAAPPNLVAAAEFAKRISSVNPKEEKPEMERERSGRSSDRSSQRERDRNGDENVRSRNDSKEKTHDRDRERDREDRSRSENKKLLDAKQLIDMIPKTKDELFAYEINWAIYDQHGLHERMRPWISKKITEFLGEEEPTLVDYIVSSTKDHVKASKMLELLQSILDDEAEMFVLKMWRMLIFEIKKVETGLSGKSKA